MLPIATKARRCGFHIFHKPVHYGSRRLIVNRFSDEEWDAGRVARNNPRPVSLEIDTWRLVPSIISAPTSRFFLGGFVYFFIIIILMGHNRLCLV